METITIHRCIECERPTVNKGGDAAAGHGPAKNHPRDIEPCTAAAHPEMARNDTPDDVCDDGRGW
jgi:hypothetical protein